MGSDFGFQVKFIVIYYKNQQQSKNRVESSPKKQIRYQEKFQRIHHCNHHYLEKAIQS